MKRPPIHFYLTGIIIMNIINRANTNLEVERERVRDTSERAKSRGDPQLLFLSPFSGLIFSLFFPSPKENNLSVITSSSFSELTGTRENEEKIKSLIWTKNR